MKFVIDETKDKMITSLLKSGKNVMLTGATGAGKTTYCFEIANDLDMNCEVINCGSTQDARTSLLGFFQLKDGNTEFTPSSFIKAIQTENTLIVLDGVNSVLPSLSWKKPSSDVLASCVEPQFITSQFMSKSLAISKQ